VGEIRNLLSIVAKQQQIDSPRPRLALRAIGSADVGFGIPGSSPGQALPAHSGSSPMKLPMPRNDEVKVVSGRHAKFPLSRE
jgi:hypothetical protein